MSERVSRDYYPDGALHSELAYRPDNVHYWVVRTWHPNGVLASEIPIFDGIPEGRARYWNEKGELIGSYEMHDGTGVMKTWYPSGGVQFEISYVDRRQQGGHFFYDENGEVLSQSYYIAGREVSKKKYIEACQQDESLPRYAILEKEKPKSRKIKKSFTKHEQSPEGGEFFSRFLGAPDTREALEWLKGRGDGIRTLGELPDTESSVDLVEEVYRLGAVKVWAGEIDADDPDVQGSGRLVIELPHDKAARRHVLKWCAGWAEKRGFEADEDIGQKHVFVMLD